MSLVKSTPGGFNALLYRAQATGQAFLDIAAGTNSVSATPCSVCNAGAGYDDITGLGEPLVGAAP